VQTGIQSQNCYLDSHFRGNDGSQECVIPCLTGNPEKKPYFPVLNLSKKNKAKTETTLLPYLFSIKRNENKIFNKVIMFALIHLPSTKVYMKNKVLNKSAINAFRGNDRWKNRQECLFYRMTLFFFFYPILESSGNSNLQKPPHPIPNTD